MKSLGAKIENELSHDCHVIACRFQFPQWTPLYSYQEGHNSVWVYKISKYPY